MKHPEEVKKAIKMVSEQGVRRIHRMIKSKLTSGNVLGYSASGEVIAVGEGIDDLAIGDRVACAGAQCAHHAEIIRVPRNLVAPLADTASVADASTVTLGAIALQGVRRLEPSMGEIVIVVGLGILGQLTIQLLNANGCRVVGVDVDRERAALARRMGADSAFHPDDEAAIDHVRRLTDGYGADGVIVTASGSSSQILSDAFRMCRKRGRVVLVGDVGMELRRADLFKNELDFRISTSYGPGRYDPTYEEGGIDYPFGYVRWTENRNMSEYLRLVSAGRIQLDGIVSKTVDVDDAGPAYQALKDGSGGLIVLLHYPERPLEEVLSTRVEACVKPTDGRVRVGVVGAGSFAKGMHLPNIERMPKLFSLRAILGRSGHNAKAVADQFGAAYATTELEEMLGDDELDAVLITSRHNAHGSQVLAVLQVGKHAFVEKPLALTAGELDAIESFYGDNPHGPMLLTGFNRRFSPHMSRLREIVADRSNPMILNYRMNAGHIPLDHWVHGEEGGGRNIGEACHIYDLFTALTGAEVRTVSAHAIQPNTKYYSNNDNFVATMSFADGSVATLTYTALGTKSYPKERLDVFVDGKVIELDDYKTLTVNGARQQGVNTKRMEKGQEQEIRAFGEAIAHGGEWPIPLWQQLQASRIALDVERQIQSADQQKPVSV